MTGLGYHQAGVLAHVDLVPHLSSARLSRNRSEPRIVARNPNGMEMIPGFFSSISGASRPMNDVSVSPHLARSALALVTALLIASSSFLGCRRGLLVGRTGSFVATARLAASASITLWAAALTAFG